MVHDIADLYAAIAQCMMSTVQTEPWDYLISSATDVQLEVQDAAQKRLKSGVKCQNASRNLQTGTFFM